MIKLMGVDVGYGFVKLATGDERVTFPSVIGLATPREYESSGLTAATRTAHLAIEVDDTRYLVGEQAIRHSDLAFRSVTPDRLQGPELKVLMLMAMALYADKSTTTYAVVTGLPPGRMHEAHDLREMLTGEHHVRIQTEGTWQERVLRVERLQVLPQGLGAFLHSALDPRGQVSVQELLEGRVGVIDVGFGTSDLVDIMNGDYIEHRSHTFHAGLATAYQLLAHRIRREYGLTFENHQMDDIVDAGHIKVAGKKVDLTPWRDEAMKALAAKVVAEAKSAWEVEALDQVLITGGGGVTLAPYLLEQLPHGRLVETPVTANARGYLSWANREFNPAGTNWRASTTA